jgi:alpha-D-xyloside xylohydrolase
MRPLVMDFSEDATATRCQYEFMFGKSILVAPITEPGVDVWEVYLPNRPTGVTFGQVIVPKADKRLKLWPPR